MAYLRDLQTNTYPHPQFVAGTERWYTLYYRRDLLTGRHTWSSQPGPTYLEYLHAQHLRAAPLWSALTAAAQHTLQSLVESEHRVEVKPPPAPLTTFRGTLYAGATVQLCFRKRREVYHRDLVLEITTSNKVDWTVERGFCRFDLRLSCQTPTELVTKNWPNYLHVHWHHPEEGQVVKYVSDKSPFADWRRFKRRVLEVPRGARLQSLQLTAHTTTFAP